MAAVAVQMILMVASMELQAAEMALAAAAAADMAAVEKPGVPHLRAEVAETVHMEASLSPEKVLTAAPAPAL